MSDLPSVKTHPMLMYTLFSLIIIGVFIGGIIGGWMLRVALESRAELAVVLDDSDFMKWLEQETDKWADEYLSLSS